MTFLESLDSPAELRRLDTEECEVLAKEIRDHLITSVAGPGGHLGPHLGAVRQRDGLSGYPSRAESEHDVLENSHASASLSWADGIAKARQLTGQDDRHVVAVIGDGALTGGMSWEALNTIAADTSTPPRRL